MTNRQTTGVTYRAPKLSASRASLLFGTALGVSIAIFAASPQQAWAADECGADVGGVAVCTNVGNPYPNGVDYVGDAGEDITVVLLGGGLAPNIVTGAAQDGVTATASAGFNATVYTYAASTIDATLNGIEVDSGTGNSYVDSAGTINASLAGINAYSFSGSTVVENSGDITADGLAGGASLGIYAGGYDYTYVGNSGTISATEASGSQAEGIFAYTYSGDAVIDNSGEITATNTVGLAAGIVGVSGANFFLGDVDVTNTADITANGAAGATGIYVDAYGYGTVTSTGDLSATATAGAARGVDVTALYDADVTVTGNIDVSGTTSAYGVEVDTNLFDATADATVNVTGDITAAAGTTFGEGVDVYAGGDISVTVDGTITASGAGAYGVFAYSYYGDVTVAVDDITATTTVGGGAGIDAFAAGTAGLANITITAGDISTTGTNVEGVDAVALFGDVNITTGDVTTTGATAEGIYTVSYYDTTIVAGDISTTGAGAQGVDSLAIFGNVDITVASATTTGAGAVGVYGYSLLGSTEIDATTVSTTGANSGGVYAYGFGTANVDAGSVTTVGDNSIGVEARGYDGTTVETDLVVTSGNSSTGILAVSADSYVLVNSGTVNTTGDGADGIQAASLGADATDYVTINSDAITTDGLASDGIVAYAYAGDITIDSGTIGTLGDDSFGIYAYAYFGNNDVTSDAITTTGLGSVGIYAYSFLGSTTVDSGSVATTGDGATGIYAYGFTGASVTSDTVSTAGDGADGIDAISFFSPVSVDSGSVTTTGDGSIGILAHGYGGTTVTSTTVSTDGLASEGIVAIDILGPTSVTSGDVDTLGDYSTGIRAGSYYDVTVDSGTVQTSGDSSIGINAYSLGGAALGDGSVTVTFDTVETNGGAALAFTVPYLAGNFYYYADTSDGIRAIAATGEVSVIGGDVTTNGIGASGVVASGFGSVFVNVDDVVTNGAGLIYYDGPVVTTYYSSAGINGNVVGGDLTVFADTVETHGYGAAGIVATGYAYYDSVATTYSGDVVVGVNSVETFGDYADGVFATNSGGDVTVNTGFVTTHGDGSDGIIASANSYYDSSTISVLVGNAYAEADFVVTYGNDAYGILAASQGGDATVNAFSVHTYGDGSTGIYAAAFNYYDSSLGAEQNLQGNVEIDASFVTTEGIGANGIEAYAEGGSIDIDSYSVRTLGDNSAGIYATAAYYGIDPVLFTYYSGDIRIESNYVYTYGDNSDGINAFAAGGDVNIYSVNVAVYGLGSDAIVASTGGLDVNNSDDVFVRITGNTYSEYGRGVAVDSAGESDIRNLGGDLYGYVWGIQSASVDGTYVYNSGSITGGFGAAIDADGGAATIYNYGYIAGYMDLTDNADYVLNDDTWEAYGTSDFGLGADLVANYGTVGFSRYQGAASNTYFDSLENFDNFGLVTGVDDQAGDYLYISGNFFGGAGSELALDVELGGPGSIADVLVIGSASGVTEILPNDTLGASPGALNFGGILVVDSANPAEAGTEFTMANVDKGFIEYELFFDAANDDWLIVGLPDDEVFELLGAMSSSQDFWKRSGDAISARWQEIRDSNGAGGMNAGPGGMGRSDGWELWMQAHGGDESFDNAETFAIGGFTFATDLTADTDWRGFQFGFDNLQGDMLWGLTMGFNQQETTFDFDNNSFDTEGWNIGGYFGWTSGGFFLNALVKGDFFEQDANFHTLPSIFSFDGTTWGVTGELGYRWGGDGFFFEPLASVSWNTTDLDSVTTAGATIDFDDSESFRGKFGARIGGQWGSGDVVVTPYIGAYYMDEWEGDNALTFTTGITSITFNDQGRGSYGMADFGMTFQTFYGLEGFVKGEWNFGGDAEGGAARLGARWRW